MSAEAAVTWFQIDGMIRPALAAAKLSEGQEAELLDRYGIESVEQLPASRARAFVKSIADAAPGRVWVPPEGAFA